MKIADYERSYVKAVFAAHRVFEHEIRAAKAISKSPINGSIFSFVNARVDAESRYQAAERAAWAILFRARCESKTRRAA